MAWQDPSTDIENVNAAYRIVAAERDGLIAEIERLREKAARAEMWKVQAKDAYAQVERLREERRQMLEEDAAMTDAPRDVYVCPECASAAFEPFSCGGPHQYIRKDGTKGKRLVYRFVVAIRYTAAGDCS